MYMHLYASSLVPMQGSGQPMGTLGACCASALVAGAALLMWRRRAIVGPVALKALEGHVEQQQTGASSEQGSETGRCSPQPYEPFEENAAAAADAGARTEEHWLAAIERVVLVHEDLRAAAAQEAAANMRTLEAEVSSLEAALAVSEARRARDALAWRKGLAVLLATGRLTLGPSAER